MNQEPFLSFYGKNGIIPMNQQVDGSIGHFARRRALYRQLGLLEPIIRGRRVVEFGPGTGDNALYTDSLQPSRLFLVDGNPASIEALRRKEREGLFRHGVHIVHENILNFAFSDHFDVVLCEAVIPGQRDPSAFLRKVAEHVDQGGCLIFTVISALSYLAEICRRLLLPFMRDKYPREDELLCALVELFRPGLDSLKGMSRRHDDWVMDNILHPWTQRGRFFSADRALRVLDGDFSPVGSAPSYFQDWRWFKSIPGDTRSDCQVWEESYRIWRAFLLDYRVSPVSGGILPAGDDLEKIAEEIVERHNEFLDSGEFRDLEPIENLFSSVLCMVRSAMPGTARSIEAFLGALVKFKKGDVAVDLGAFHPWFGRGQQYLHFVRN